jgi:hypothetical protein
MQDICVRASKGILDFAKIPLKTLIPYSFAQLSPGNYKCKLVLRNMKTGASAVASEKITIQEKNASSLELNAPILLISKGDSLFIRGVPEEEKTKSPSFLDIYPFNPKVFSPFLGELPLGTPRIFAAMTCIYKKGSVSDISSALEVTSKTTGNKMNVEYKKNVSERGDLKLILFQLSTEDLTSGEYILTITTQEPQTSSFIKNQTSFRIRSY